MEMRTGMGLGMREGPRGAILESIAGRLEREVAKPANVFYLGGKVVLTKAGVVVHAAR
jgi:hypothetical protein